MSSFAVTDKPKNQQPKTSDDLLGDAATGSLSQAWHHFGVRYRGSDTGDPRARRRIEREADWGKFFQSPDADRFAKRDVVRDIVQMADYCAYRCLNANDQSERLQFFSEFMEEISYLFMESAGDIDHWVRRLIIEMQVDLNEARSGRDSCLFKTDEGVAADRENFSLEEWSTQAYVVFFYRVFKRSGLRESDAAEEVEKFLKEKNIRLNGVTIYKSHVLNIKRNFPREDSPAKAKKVAQDHLKWLTKKIPNSIDDARAICNAYAELGLYKKG